MPHIISRMAAAPLSSQYKSQPKNIIYHNGASELTHNISDILPSLGWIRSGYSKRGVCVPVTSCVHWKKQKKRDKCVPIGSNMSCIKKKYPHGCVCW